MVSIAPRRESSTTLRKKLETAGLTMLESTNTQGGAHILLLPRKPRIEDGRFLWNGVDPVEKNPRETQQCFWDYLGLADLADGALQQGVLAFVYQWGVLDYGVGEIDFRPYGRQEELEGSASLDDWPYGASRLRTLLLAILNTAQGKVIPVDMLKSLRGSYESLTPRRLELGEDVYRRRTLADSMEAMGRASETEWLERVQVERRQGRGLELQRMVIVNRLSEWVNPRMVFVPVWERDDIRGIRTVAHGVEEIVGAHLLEVFGTEPLDVYICSVCGRPYPWDEKSQRRPRAGARRFCSDACRAQGRRTTNLASWHRNKARWRSSINKTRGR